MNGTLYSLELLDSGIGFILAGLIGVLFGFFLEQAGFGSSRRLTGAFYFRDMAVLKVLLTAVVVALLGVRFLTAFGWLDLGQVVVLDTYWGAQIVGGLVLGIGLVVGGWCPATALVGLASAKLDALVFLVGAVFGSILFSELFPLVQPLYEGRHVAGLHLDTTLDLPPERLMVLLCGAAVLVFTVSSWLQQVIGRQPSPDPSIRRRRAAAALALLALAWLTTRLPEAPSGGTHAGVVPAWPAAFRTAPEPGLVAELAAERTHIAPLELAELLQAGTPDLLVVDIRPAAAFAQFHLPGAINVPIEDLETQATSKLPTAGRIVLVANGTPYAAQAWLALRRQGRTDVCVLTDGMLGFWRECLTPPSLTEAPPTGSATAALAQAYQARRDFFLTGAPVAAPDGARAPADPASPPPSVPREDRAP